MSVVLRRLLLPGRRPTTTSRRALCAPVRTLDKAELKQLTLRVVDDLAGATATQLIYIGDKIGLFKEMAQAGPLTATALAQRVRCHPRYVETWLDACVAHSFAEKSAPQQTYSMTAAQVEVLANDGGRFCQVGGAQMIAAQGMQLGAIIERGFRAGGGVSFAEFGPDAREGVCRVSQTVVRDLLPQWLRDLPESAAVLEGGQEARGGSVGGDGDGDGGGDGGGGSGSVRVLDVGCGLGESSLALSRAFPHATILGIDPDKASVAGARDRLRGGATGAGANGPRARGTDGADEDGPVAFAACRIEDRAAISAAAGSDPFDVILAYDCVHDMADPLGSLRAIRSLLAPRGVFLWFEPHGSDDPYENREILGARMVAGIALTCVTNSMAHGGAGLGAHGCTPLRAEALAREAGFATFRHDRGMKGAALRNNVYVCTVGGAGHPEAQ